MATRPTFTWLPEKDGMLNQVPNIVVTKFGDGYESRVAKGINWNPEIWTLQFTMADPDLRAALTFIQSLGGVNSFYWTSPLGVTNIYICRKWRTTHKTGVYLLNFDFEQVFEYP